ncbi:probable aminotransferase TAT2 [Cornus florida]|uniref:probable aminotransferase TAT2 n=1 Tax=Cornus florida TaxID=4283 RepID=UPI00289C5C0D|nr:probable aminotransferase TAT2 [Cornus florida]
MENGRKNWVNGANGQELETPSNITIKGIIGLLLANVDPNDNRRVSYLGRGDPSAYSCFHTTAVAVALRSHNFNGYAPIVGLPQTRMAIADHLSHKLPYKLSPDDVYVTVGCTQSIDVALSILSRPGANILLPRPGFPTYELSAAITHLEVRHFDLLPEKSGEVDLDAIEALADHNTVAMVIINPGNPCGNVYTYQHLNKIAETAKKLKIIVISDEVYGHLAFGATPFMPMGVFAIQVKLNPSLLKDISDDIDFCFKLAKEESVIILPGLAVGLKTWLRITFAVEPSSLEEAFGTIKCFCQRHSHQPKQH